MQNNYTIQVGDTVTSNSSSYKVVKILGSGSFGQVVLCHKATNNQMVALKVLKNPEDILAGRQEARILQMLRGRDCGSHHIVQCMDSFLYKGHYCHEFEKLDIDLRGFLRTCPDKRLEINHIRPIIAQMARALVFLKTEGIVHGDLKPENTMKVDHVGQPLRIKVIDFGLACLVNKVKKGTRLQTHYYRAPEVQVGGTITEATAMWSVGCIAAEMFLGKFLFLTRDRLDLMRHIIQIVGQPPKHVLDSGKRTRQYFRQPKGSAVWEPKVKSLKHCHPLTITSLDDIINFNSALVTNAELYDRSLFVDLLKRMLDVDPNSRITPEEVLNHPFITMSPIKAFFPSYYFTSQKIMVQVMNFPSQEQQSVPSCVRQIINPSINEALYVNHFPNRLVPHSVTQIALIPTNTASRVIPNNTQISLAVDITKASQSQKPENRAWADKAPFMTTTGHRKKRSGEVLFSGATTSVKRKREEVKEEVVVDAPSPPSKHSRYYRGVLDCQEPAPTNHSHPVKVGKTHPS